MRRPPRATGTASMTAGIVIDPLGVAILTSLDVATKKCFPAVREQEGSPMGEQRLCVLGAEGLPMIVQDAMQGLLARLVGC
ncbi:MAG: hypothetical protein ABL921_29645 [Pirellula sp.]